MKTGLNVIYIQKSYVSVKGYWSKGFGNDDRKGTSDMGHKLLNLTFDLWFEI